MLRFGAGVADDEEPAGAFVEMEGDVVDAAKDEEGGRMTGVLGLLTGVLVVDGAFLTGADDAATPFASDEVEAAGLGDGFTCAFAAAGDGLAFGELEDEAC